MLAVTEATVSFGQVMCWVLIALTMVFGVVCVAIGIFGTPAKRPVEDDGDEVFVIPDPPAAELPVAQGPDELPAIAAAQELPAVEPVPVPQEPVQVVPTPKKRKSPRKPLKPRKY